MNAARLSAAAVVAGSCTASIAQTWSTIANFSSTTNPSPPWRYGWRPAITGSTFTLFDRPFEVTAALPAWTGSAFPSNVPMVGANMTVNTQSVPGTSIAVPPCTTWATPGAAGQYAAFRFVAPHEGQYNVWAMFQRIDPTGPASVPGVVSIAATVVYNQAIPASGELQTFQGGPYFLLTGQFIDLIVGPGQAAGGATRVEGFVEQGPPRCWANCDGSTTVPFLNVNDFICFQHDFASGSPNANCDGSTITPILNVHDFICFQSRYAAGCSSP
jgi:hypothetical protein